MYWLRTRAEVKIAVVNTIGEPLLVSVNTTRLRGNAACVWLSIPGGRMMRLWHCIALKRHICAILALLKAPVPATTSTVYCTRGPGIRRYQRTQKACCICYYMPMHCALYQRVPCARLARCVPPSHQALCSEYGTGN